MCMSGRYSRASLAAGRKQPRSAPIKRINALWNTTVTTLPHVCRRVHSFGSYGDESSLFGYFIAVCSKYLCTCGGAAAACAGVRLAGFFSGFLGWRAGCGADLGGCAVAALVASGFHGLSVYPRGVYRKGVLRVVTRYGFSCRDFLRREFSLWGRNPCRICAMV